jgi:hypothetical protein
MSNQALVPQNILLISENKLKNFTDIDQNVTSAVLLPFVGVVQQTKLEYIIGRKYYVELLDQVATSSLTTINNNFLQYFVQPLLIWAAYAEALPSIFMRIKNNGIVAGSEKTITISEMQYMQTAADDRSQFFERRMIEELIYNQPNYPAVYTYTSTDGMRPHLGKNYFSGIHLNNGPRYQGLNVGPGSGVLTSVIYSDPTWACCGW